LRAPQARGNPSAWLLDCFASLAMTNLIVPFLLLVLVACSDRPPAPSAEENRQLDEAEAMLDEMESNAAAD
jgi:hypothetical protein